MSELIKKTLIINGAERTVVCDPEKDTLATMLRRIGLTGVKVGCNMGVCGACSVILDGKVIRACTRKMKLVKERSSIITIEGIGTPMHLHPLQQAWITYGAVQCGFCSPGFIVSAYGLLMENPSPTREEVRDWFEKHRNICRCTGYKQLVDAVMAAAAVMRGEKTMDDITFKLEGDLYGSNYPRPNALAKVCGVADYGDDLGMKMPEGTAHLAMVISEVSHANIISIDTSEAEKMPGVIKVLTAEDVKGVNKVMPLIPANHPREQGRGMINQEVIASKKINKRGDVVALVAADTLEHAREAAKKVVQNVERLPEYLNFLDAAAPNAIQIYPGMPNVHCIQPVFKGRDTREVLEESAYVVEGSFSTQHEPHLPIEPDTVQGYWGADGCLTIHSKSHFLKLHENSVALATGLPNEKVRVIQNPTGGSFGYSVSGASSALVAVAVQNLNMPCTLTMSYEEHNHYTGKRTSAYTNARLGCDEQGKITGAEFDIGLGHGAYASIGDPILATITRVGYYGYHIPNVMGLGRLGVTNMPEGASYRGFGMPQVSTATESMVDMLAKKAGMDPFEFRYINMARPGDLNLNSFLYKEYPMVQLMDLARPYYEEYRKSADANSTETRKRGVGISVGGFNVTLGSHDHAEVALELNADGTFTHHNTWHDIGQGGDIGTLTVTVKALEELKIRPEQIILNISDSKNPNTGIAAASRSHFMAGYATIDAAQKLISAMRKDDGTFRTYDEMVAEGIPTKYQGVYDLTGKGGLVEPDPNTGVGDRVPAYMYCVNLAEVEVDTATGKTKVLRMVTVSDCGVLGNVLAVDGQAYGGLSHCIGFALSEDYSDVNKHSNILACGIPTITEIPDDMTVIHVQNPREWGPFGSSGASENFQSSGHMAVINGITDATGIRIYELPAKPEKVKAALDAQARGEDMEPQPYYLGSDFYETMDDILDNPI